uniref:DUF1722 domain-containing protein n=1 Tax=Magnetococcus massalia (strain MO-1) TaxID=451514 RepID=A0A1S7LEV3_MAGMO|nr:conserved protein of unknown function [Candidatus Magnetococcus massalia]
MAELDLPIRIGISHCLLGEEVRFDGGHKQDRYLTDTLGAFFEYLPLCPEVEAGLGIPREAMHLEGEADAPRLISIRTQRDLTEPLRQWSQQAVARLRGERLSGFIFKSRSPSCGMERVKLYHEHGSNGPQGTKRQQTRGLFAAAFMHHFPLIPVEEEGRLHDAAIRENFIERVFVYHRWLVLMAQGVGAAELVDFHTRHKFLIMAHDRQAMKQLGQLVAEDSALEERLVRYVQGLMQALAKQATVKRQVDVLMHLMGFFKKKLTTDEKAELLEQFEHYRQQRVPLIVPITLINHYVRKFQVDYLADQWYLKPHPMELKLRNHA